MVQCVISKCRAES